MLVLPLAACSSNGAEGETSSETKAASSSSSLQQENSKVSNTESSDSAETSSESSQSDSSSQADPSADKKILVVYFSCTGNTQKIAEAIAEETGADIYRIVPAQEYTADDLNYNDSKSRTSLEQNDPASRPQIDGTIENWDQYDIIFLGHPIWWGQEPRIMDTFVETYDFTEKTVIPFCTSACIVVGSSASNMEKLAGTGTWMQGTRFSAGTFFR